MLKSRKEFGKYEGPLIKTLDDFLTKKGYTVSPHARLNVAWSKVISDVDVLAVFGELLTIIEVKSDRDDFYRGFNQLEKMKGFADRLYIATNRQTHTLKQEKWSDSSIGLMRIDNAEVEIIKPAQQISAKFGQGAFSQLRKKCLARLARLLSVPTYLPKTEIEKRLREKFDNQDLKAIVKSIVLCDHDCKNDCILEPFLVTSCNNLKAIGKKSEN